MAEKSVDQIQGERKIRVDQVGIHKGATNRFPTKSAKRGISLQNVNEKTFEQSGRHPSDWFSKVLCE